MAAYPIITTLAVLIATNLGSPIAIPTRSDPYFCEQENSQTTLDEVIGRIKTLELEYLERKRELKNLDQKTERRNAIFNGFLSAKVNVNPDHVNFAYSYEPEKKTCSLRIVATDSDLSQSSFNVPAIDAASIDLRTAYGFFNELCVKRNLSATEISWKVLDGITDRVGFELDEFPLSQFIILAEDIGIPKSWLDETLALEARRCQVLKAFFNVGQEVDQLKFRINTTLIEDFQEDGLSDEVPARDDEPKPEIAPL